MNECGVCGTTFEGERCPNAPLKLRVEQGAMPPPFHGHSKIMRVADLGNGSYRLIFRCPGCKMCHGPSVGPVSPSWAWNGDMDSPTFEPSLVVRWDHLSAEGRERVSEFRLVHGRNPTDDEVPYDLHMVCHSFIRDGSIQFLSDCTHELANQTVPIPPFEW